MEKAGTESRSGSKKRVYVLKVIIEDDPFDDGRIAYRAYCPSLKGASTWGYTKAETLENIREVARMTVESMIEHGESIPEAPNGQSLSGRWVSVTI